MVTKKINASIIYDENCHYKQSSKDIEITLPLRTPKINVTFSNQILYYNIPIDINIFIQDDKTLNAIPYGNIILYYIDENDPLQEKNKISKEPYDIDKNGNVIINYIPHTNGRLIIEYNGEPYYENTTKEVYIELSPQPTQITFNKSPPYLVDPNDVVELDVTVTDQYNEPINYGIVTFLNYIQNDGNEKVIGNPVFLNELGQAKINYSPIQNNYQNNLENICAVYNYDNEAYGTQWKYYLQDRAWTTIAIRENNSINMLVPKINNNQDIKILDNGLFIANINNNLLLQCEVTINNQAINNAEVTFIIYNNDFETSLSANFNNENDFYQTSYILENIPEGLYKVYAQVNNSSNIGLQQNTSEEFYLKIEPRETNLTLNLEVLENPVFDKTLNADNVSLTITDNNNNNLLNGHEVFFVIPELNKKINGTITIENNVLKAKPSANINISKIGDYRIYAYIEETEYTYNNIKYKYYDTYSNEVIIKNRNLLNISLNLEKNTDYYPGNIKYTISTDTDLYNAQNISLIIDNNKFLLNDKISINNKQINGTLPSQDIGEHNVIAKVEMEDYNIVSSQKTFTIEKADIIFSLDQNSSEIYSSQNADIIFNLKTENGKIKNINANDFQVVLRKEYDNNIIEDELDNITINNTLLKATTALYDDEEWKIKVNYVNENGNYNVTNNSFVNFTVNNYKPYCIDNNIDNPVILNKQIVYIASSLITETQMNESVIVTETLTPYSINQYILVICKVPYNNNTITITTITDNNGYFTISPPNNVSQEIWKEAIKDAKYYINPKHNILNTLKTSNNIVSDFKNQMSNYQGNDNNINMLYLQAYNYHFVSLFLGYNETELTSEELDVQIYQFNDEEDNSSE